MAQAVIRWPLIAEARVRSRLNPCGKRSGNWTVFFRVIELPPLTLIPRLLRTHLQLQVALNDKRAKHGSIPKSKALSKSRERCHILHSIQTLISLCYHQLLPNTNILLIFSRR